MLDDKLVSLIEKNKCAKDYFAKVKRAQNSTLAIASSARPFFTALTWQFSSRPLLVLIAGEQASRSFARQLSFFIGRKNVEHFPEIDKSYFSDKQISKEVAGKRNLCIDLLHRGQNKVIVSSTEAFLSKVSGDESFYLPIELTVGDEIEDIDSLVLKLNEFGYENVKRVKQRGQFSFKGGALDVFAANQDFAVRIDFFGDEVESIRRIFSSSAQTIANVDNIKIYPCCLLPLAKKNLNRAKEGLTLRARTDKFARQLLSDLESGINLDEKHLLLPHLCKTKNLGQFINEKVDILFIETQSLLLDARRIYEREQIAFKGSGSSVDDFVSSPSVLQHFKSTQISFESILTKGFKVDSRLKILRTNPDSSSVSLKEKIQTWFEAGFYVLFSCIEPNVATRFKEEFDRIGFSISSSNRGETLKKRVVNFVEFDIPLGFVVPDLKLAIVSSNDFKETFKTRDFKDFDITKITFPYLPGDYVVHSTFGIAKFKSIIKKIVDGVQKDYIELSYAQGDKLFLPIEQFDRVTKYVGPKGDAPKLTRLNTHDWSRAIGRARAATRKLAFDLVDVYARRANVEGFSFVITSAMKSALDKTFEHIKTPDQTCAIEDVFRDMASNRVMDRLICGDVGFGKTEVAIRACYVCAKNNKQTIVLCPTTILCEQHFETFRNRLDKLGVSVDVISRFKTLRQQKETLSRFSTGKTDVLIGTHRLLSSDVNPKDLGLVIIDEEQRFGVGHKEKLKNLREVIDVLALSATPIPRTLQMSLSGIRDMSLILTPPKDRRAVSVFVGAFDFDKACEAIRFELARSGQVYFVYNRVNTIDLVEEKIKEIVPEANVAIAHGQMSKIELESVMEAFAARKIDVLIATTIIENGIDNPNTNCLIIADSHNLGLSQMYQLKGRVGRSSRDAYAYFFYPENMPIGQKTLARLQAIGEHTELGSGLQIAMRDLEIRGAGEMFGAEQSGNLSEVGFDLFSAMLSSEIIRERSAEDDDNKSNVIQALSDISINISESALLPEDYIEDVKDRVLIYRQVASIKSIDSLNEIINRVQQKFGQMPDVALNFFSKAKLRIFAYSQGINSISMAKGYLVANPIAIDDDKLQTLRLKSALYSKKTSTLKVPIKNISKTDESHISAALEFLESLI